MWGRPFTVASSSTAEIRYLTDQFAVAECFGKERAGTMK
jgi:hypothetical protein